MEGEAWHFGGKLVISATSYHVGLGSKTKSTGTPFPICGSAKWQDLRRFHTLEWWGSSQEAVHLESGKFKVIPYPSPPSSVPSLEVPYASRVVGESIGNFLGYPQSLFQKSTKVMEIGRQLWRGPEGGIKGRQGMLPWAIQGVGVWEGGSLSRCQQGSKRRARTR